MSGTRKMFLLMEPDAPKSPTIFSERLNSPSLECGEDMF